MNATFFRDDQPPANMTGTQETLVTPFRVIADVREEADGWRFEALLEGARPARAFSVPLEYRCLDLADYVVEELRLYIVRKRAAELAKAMRHWPESVCQELSALRALEAAGASCLLVIEGTDCEVEQLLEFDDTIFADASAGVPWLFAPSRGAAERIVLAVIQRAWQRARREE